MVIKGMLSAALLTCCVARAEEVRFVTMEMRGFWKAPSEVMVQAARHHQAAPKRNKVHKQIKRQPQPQNATYRKNA